MLTCNLPITPLSVATYLDSVTVSNFFLLKTSNMTNFVTAQNRNKQNVTVYISLHSIMCTSLIISCHLALFAWAFTVVMKWGIPSKIGIDSCTHSQFSSAMPLSNGLNWLPFLCIVWQNYIDVFVLTVYIRLCRGNQIKIWSIVWSQLWQHPFTTFDWLLVSLK